jgi:hypothetical protein
MLHEFSILAAALDQRSIAFIPVKITCAQACTRKSASAPSDIDVLVRLEQMPRRRGGTGDRLSSIGHSTWIWRRNYHHVPAF